MLIAILKTKGVFQNLFADSKLMTFKNKRYLLAKDKLKISSSNLLLTLFFLPFLIAGCSFSDTAFIIPSEGQTYGNLFFFVITIAVIFLFIFINICSYRSFKMKLMKQTKELALVNQELKYQQEQFQALVNNAPGASFRLKMNDKLSFSFISSEIESLTGYAIEKLKNEKISFLDIIYEDDLDSVRDEINKQVRENGVFSIEHRIITNDKKIKWVYSKGQVQIDKTGKPCCIDGIFVDISSFKDLVTKLHESEQKTRAIFDHTFELIGLLSPEGVLLDVNQSALDLYGIESSSVKGHFFWETPWWSYSQSEQQKLIESIKQAAQGQTVKCESKHRLPDNSILVVDFSIKPIFNSEGKVIFLVPEGRDVTEHKKILSELKMAKEFAENLLDAANVIIVTLNEQGNIISFNSFAEQLTGYAKEDMIGKNWFEIFIPEREQINIPKVFKDVLENSPKSMQYENPIVIKSGEERLINWNNKTLFDDTNEICGVMSIGIDITEKKYTENILLESENKFRSITENALDYIFIKNSLRKFVFINRAMKELMDTSESFIDEFATNQFFDQNQADIIKAIDDKVFKGEIVAETISIKVKNKNKFYSLVQTPLSRKNNEVVSVLGIARDITSLKKAEQEIFDLRNYLSNVINSMPSMIIGVDAQENITQWNREAEKKTGFSQNSVKGKSLKEILPWLGEEMWRVSQAIKTKQQQTNFKKIRKKKSVEIYEYISIYPLLADNASGAVIRIDDITQRVKLEEMVVQTEKMVSLGGIAAGMAHEINNPLAVVVQGVQNIIRRLSTDLDKNIFEAQKHGVTLNQLNGYLKAREVDVILQDIKQAGLRASDIIMHMLNFSKQGNVSFVLADINEIIEESIELVSNDYNLKNGYDFKKIEISKDYQKDIPFVSCVKTELKQVFLNLFKNGAEVMQSLPMFHIHTYLKQNYVYVEISDNGPGIPEKISKRIFDPFFSTKPVGKGTGLGLSVSYYIIKQNHNGNMWVESSDMGGAKFVIELPLRRD